MQVTESLYGLKQSSRNWNSKFSEFLKSEGFGATPEDHCVYVRRTDRKPTTQRNRQQTSRLQTGQDVLIVCLYVDDGLICGSDAKAVEAFIMKLKQAFEVTVNEPHCYVGMEIERDRTKKQISISQKGYVSRMLERFGMSEAKSLITPMDSSCRLDIEDSKDAFVCPVQGSHRMPKLPVSDFPTRHHICSEPTGTVLQQATDSSLERRQKDHEVPERDFIVFIDLQAERRVETQWTLRLRLGWRSS